MLSWVYRFLFMVALGVTIALGFRFLAVDTPQHSVYFDIAAIVIVTIVIWGGNLQIDKLLNNKMPWLNCAIKRLFIQLAISLAFTLSALTSLISLAHLFIDKNDHPPQNSVDPLLIPGILIAFIVLVIEIGSQFFKAWRDSIIQIEQLKTEQINAQLLHLKNQINPHFLFNNLSVLSSLVYIDQDKAVSFINELSKVYRYLLDNKTAELVVLSEELIFLNHYIYLLKIKFEGGINFNFNIDNELKGAFIPPMCLQILIENTIQHNEISQAQPLIVSVYTSANSLVVENSIQNRSDCVASTQTGLKNIRQRFLFYTNEDVIIFNDGQIFRVVLPLILKK